MKRIQKATVKQPHRLQAPKRSPLSSLNLSKVRTSRQILRKVARSTELSRGDIATEAKLAVGYYVYTISVAGVVRYIGKGKGLRLYSHMKEVRSRLKRDFRVQSIALLWQIEFTPQSRADPLSAVRAALKRSHDEIDDSVAHGWQAWLRWWSVVSFFPASLG